VAEQLVQAEQIRQRYQAFKTERDALTGKKRRQLEKDLARKYSFGRSQVVEIKHRFREAPRRARARPWLLADPPSRRTL
jgi:hypothetical protein